MIWFFLGPLIAVAWLALWRTANGRFREALLSELPGLFWCSLAGQWHRDQAALILARRGKPAWRVISGMEQDIYGRTFEHDGAPKASGASGVVKVPRRAHSGLCDVGNHVYSYSERGCLICHGAHHEPEWP